MLDPAAERLGHAGAGGIGLPQRAGYGRTKFSRRQELLQPIEGRADRIIEVNGCYGDWIGAGAGRQFCPSSVEALQAIPDERLEDLRA